MKASMVRSSCRKVAAYLASSQNCRNPLDSPRHPQNTRITPSTTRLQSPFSPQPLGFDIKGIPHHTFTLPPAATLIARLQTSNPPKQLCSCSKPQAASLRQQRCCEREGGIRSERGEEGSVQTRSLTGDYACKGDRISCERSAVRGIKGSPLLSCSSRQLAASIGWLVRMRQAQTASCCSNSSKGTSTNRPSPSFSSFPDFSPILGSPLTLFFRFCRADLNCRQGEGCSPSIYHRFDDTSSNLFLCQSFILRLQYNFTQRQTRKGQAALFQGRGRKSELPWVDGRGLRGDLLERKDRDGDWE